MLLFYKDYSLLFTYRITCQLIRPNKTKAFLKKAKNGCRNGVNEQTRIEK